MRKNGFTLIELLAVIVILAIIALIATPIILGIINDAREKANERSVELYASAVRNGIAAHQLRTGNEVLPGTYNVSNPLPFEPDYEGKVECTNVIISADGKVSLDKCTVNGGTKEYSYGIKEVAKKMCTFANVGVEGKIGSKYICNLGETTETKNLIFYVLVEENVAGYITLIYEKNYDNTIHPWCETGDYVSCNADGLTNKLNEIRTSWSKITAEQIGLPTAQQIASADGKNYLDYPTLDSSWLINLENQTSYWTSTPNPSIPINACFVNYDGILTCNNNTVHSSKGIRPVITISINEI